MSRKGGAMTDKRGSTSQIGKSRRITVWDLPTRLFHWALVTLFVALWITGTEPSVLGLHVWIGEAVLVMLLFRIAWGFVGSRHSRFGDFIVGPRAVLAHLAEVAAIARRGPSAAPKEPPHAGHTRLGGWMILTLLTLLLLECVTGLFSTRRHVVDGPLRHLVDDGFSRVLTIIHSGTFNVLMALVIVHICAAFFYLLRKRENLIFPLITGRADLSAEVAAQERSLASLYFAVAVLVIAGLFVWGITSL
jgi:cytochrome b